MKNLIIGAGEVGQGLYKIFKRFHETYIEDIDPSHHDGIEILHIAFPYSDRFVLDVAKYIGQYNPELTIIHSSVQPHTTSHCGPHVVYSPVRGRHRGIGLEKEMTKFKKFVGGFDMEDVDKACAFFEMCKWETQSYDDPTVLELLKLLSNIHMGLEIAWRQEVNRILGNREYEIYGLWEDDYFSGYSRLGQQNLIRPRMKPDPIGGHCILECLKILKDSKASDASYWPKGFDWIIESNEKAKEEESYERPREAARA